MSQKLANKIIQDIESTLDSDVKLSELPKNYSEIVSAFLIYQGLESVASSLDNVAEQLKDVSNSIANK